MSFILGFGSTETAFEEQERKFVEDFVEGHKKDDGGWFTFPDEMVEELRGVLKERQEKYHKESDEYKEAEVHPDRYSYYYANVLNDLHNIVVIFDFSHINRNHALSPDGWAMWNNTEVYLFKSNP